MRLGSGGVGTGQGRTGRTGLGTVGNGFGKRKLVLGAKLKELRVMSSGIDADQVFFSCFNESLNPGLTHPKLTNQKFYARAI